MLQPSRGGVAASPATVAAPTESRTRPAIVFAIVASGVVLATIDQFAVNVAFQTIRESLHASLSAVSWVLNGYSIVFAALLVPAGRLADRSGRKNGFLLGVALFTVASAACAAAPDLAVLVAARALQALGAAFLVASSLGLLLATFPVERRHLAVGGWSAATGAAAALGPVLGGVLVAVDWRFIFVINLPIGALALVCGVRLLPTVEETPTPRPDLVGALALTVGIASVSLALVEGNDWGWTSDRVPATLVVAAASLAWFVRRSARHPSPVVELSLLRVPRFALATGAMALYCSAFSAMVLSVILWAQTAWRWSALRSGLAFAPGPLLVLAISPLSGRLTRRFGAAAVAAAGCVVFTAAGVTALQCETLLPHYRGAMLPTTVLMGVGAGLILPTLLAAGSTWLPAARFATGSGVINMSRQVGFTLGIAVLVAVMGPPGSGAHALRSFRRGWTAVAVLAVAAAVVSACLARTGEPQSSR